MSSDPSRSGEPRVVRPKDGGPTLDARFRLEDVDALTEALVRSSRGRLERLSGAASTLEEKLRRRVDESRRRITEAMETAEEQIEERVRETTERSRDAVEAAYREGHAQGERAGFEEGRARGLEEGRVDGRETAHAETALDLEERTRRIVPVLEAMLDELARERRALHDDARRDLIELSLEVARCVIRREVEIPPYPVIENVHAAIERIEARRRLLIEIHPDDRAAVDEYLSGLYGRLETEESIEIVEHPELERGGCRVRTECGTVDETIETQLALITEALLGREGTPS